MAKPTHASQFAHDIAVRVLERFDKYGACGGTMALYAVGRHTTPTTPDAVSLCVGGRIVNAAPEHGDGLAAASVQEIASLVKGTPCIQGYTGVLWQRNDAIYREHGADALLKRTRRLFERIAALPVRDDSPTAYHVGGVYMRKDGYGGKKYTVARIVPAGAHRYMWNCPIAEYVCGGWDPVSAINVYKRVA